MAFRTFGFVFGGVEEGVYRIWGASGEGTTVAAGGGCCRRYPGRRQTQSIPAEGLPLMIAGGGIEWMCVTSVQEKSYISRRDAETQGRREERREEGGTRERRTLPGEIGRVFGSCSTLRHSVSASLREI